MMQGKINRLVVSMSVRHGKSYYASRIFPAWHAMVYPERSIMLATHSVSFSEEFAYAIRTKIQDYGPRLTGVSLRKDFKSRGHFKLKEGGDLRTTAPGTSPSGKGCHLLIMDDLVKSQEEAASPAQRDKLWTWVTGEALSRLEPGGKAIAILSRRHPDDVTGRLLAMNAELPFEDQWHEIRFPAISDEGEALWPERYSITELEKIKRNYELAGQSYLFDCLYQQNPRGDAASFEWQENYFLRLLESQTRPTRFRVLAIDPSKGQNSHRGDYCSIPDVTVDTAGHLYVKPLLLRVPTDQIEDAVVALCERTHYDMVIGEAIGFQSVLLDNIVRKCVAKGVHCPMHSWQSQENKTVRIRMDLTPLLAQGRLHLVTEDRIAIGQLKEFPSASHDDFPDSLSIATRGINYLLTGA